MDKAFFKLCEAGFSPDKTREFEYTHGYIDGPLGEAGRYRIRFTISSNMKQISVNLCGDASNDTLYVLRIITQPGYNDIILPFFYSGYLSGLLFNFSIKVSYERLILLTAGRNGKTAAPLSDRTGKKTNRYTWTFWQRSGRQTPL